MTLRNSRGDPCSYWHVLFDVSVYSVSEKKRKRVTFCSHYQPGVVQVDYQYETTGVYKFFVRVDSKPVVDKLEIFVKDETKFFPTMEPKSPFNFRGIGQVGGMTLNRDGLIFVADQLNSNIAVFDRSFQLTRFIGKFGSKNGYLKKPSGLVVDRNNRLIVCDTGNDRLQMFCVNGTFKNSSTYCNLFSKPIAIDVTSSNDFIVAHSWSCLSVFDENLSLNYRINISDKFIGENPIRSPWLSGICCGYLNEIFVTDQNNGNIIVMHWDKPRLKCIRKINMGQTRRYIRGSNWMKPAPVGILKDNDGYILVTDQANNIVSAFSGDGTFVTTWQVEQSPQHLTQTYNNTYLVSSRSSEINISHYGTCTGYLTNDYRFYD